MQSSTPLQQTFGNKSQDSSSVYSEENDLPVEVHDRGLGSLSLLVNSTPGAPTEEAIAVDLVNRLPVEMLSEIFVACTHTLRRDIDKSELIELDEMYTPLPSHHYRLVFARNAIPYTVSSVCKRWRSIGLSTPELWSKFTIPDFYYLNSEREKIIVALRTWLKRSKNHPLQFTCLAYFHTGDEVFMELFKNIHRWHIAYFVHHHASYLAQEKQLFKNDGVKAENLDTLELCCGGGSLNIAFQRFPNLRRLRVHPCCLAVEEARGLSLTHLALNILKGNTATVFSLLHQFPSLISFEVPVDRLEHHSNDTPLTTFTHTALTELTLTKCGFGRSASLNILADIRLPCIRRLHLHYTRDNYPGRDMLGTVKDFIHYHESTFTNLELSGLRTLPDKTMEILHMFPKHLTLYQSGLHTLHSGHVQMLTLDHSDPTQDLAPNLSSLSLNVLWIGPSGDSLAEMILSRWARNPHTTFKFRMPDRVPNPLSDPRIARHVKYNPGLLEFIGHPLRY